MHTDPIGDLLAEATRTEIRQLIKGREVVWGLEMLDPSAALEVPEVIDMLLSSAQKLLKSRAGSEGNPALAEALAAVRDRDTKGRKVEPPTTDEAADIVDRLQRIAVQSVRSITVDGKTEPCRLVRDISQQTARGKSYSGPRLIWVGIMDRNALQAVYLAAAFRIEEALERVGRFPGLNRAGGDAGSDGEGLRVSPEPVARPAC